MRLMRHTAPELETLVAPFYGSATKLAVFDEVSANEVPAVYRQLLDHDQHMTVTLESFHHCPVDLEVLHRHISPEHYTRNTLLRRSSDGVLVQFGIARLSYDYLDANVAREIEAEDTPMGRILIGHNVLRQVRLASMWRLTPHEEMRRVFGAQADAVTYGRTAVIYCNGEPAVEVLEVMPPGLDVGDTK
jgi:chorismate-pyruvate lyase